MPVSSIIEFSHRGKVQTSMYKLTELSVLCKFSRRSIAMCKGGPVESRHRVQEFKVVLGILVYTIDNERGKQSVFRTLHGDKF